MSGSTGGGCALLCAATFNVPGLFLWEWVGEGLHNKISKSDD